MCFCTANQEDVKNEPSNKSGIECVFSPEIPKKESLILTDGTSYKKSAYGTVSYMPAVFGGVAASVVIRKLIS